MKIIPAILPLSYRVIVDGVQKVAGVVDTVQIDFVDGHFANNKTWLFNGKDEDRLKALFNQEEGLPEWETMNYEFDLMVADPLEHIDTFVALGPSKIIFHLESMDQEKMLHYFETLPAIIGDIMTFGIAINIDTDPTLIALYISYIDTIQCMGIDHVGFQGQTFDERVIDQIKKVTSLFPDKHISIDGGVTLENAPTLAQSGADTLIVGSVVFQSADPRGTIQELQHI